MNSEHVEPKISLFEEGVFQVTVVDITNDIKPINVKDSSNSKNISYFFNNTHLFGLMKISVMDEVLSFHSGLQYFIKHLRL